MPFNVPRPPGTRRDDHVDVLHGVEVLDPYRWLEDGDDPEVTAWAKGQHRRTELTLRRLRSRPRLVARLRSLLQAGSSVGCTVAGARVFSLDRWGPHDQAVLMVRSALTPGRGRVLVDPVELIGVPTAAIDWYHPSLDGRLVAFGTSTGGDERSTLRVLDVETGDLLSDTIPGARAASVAWLPDGSAFAYTRFPEPGTVPDEDLEYWRTVHWHRLGEHWREDDVLWDQLPDKAAWPNVSISPDGHWILIHLSLGWRRVDVHLIDRRTNARTVMIEGVDAVSNFAVVDDRLVGLTTLGAERGRVVTAPLHAAWHGSWTTIVPESDVVLEAIAPCARSLLVLGSRAAVAELHRYDLDGGDHQVIGLDGPGSLAGLSGSRLRDEAYFSFTSFARPPSMLRWTPGKVEDWSRLWALDPVHGPHGDYLVEQHTYRSRDGTSIPAMVVRRSDVAVGPSTPCLVAAYGGFAITMAPTYSAAVVAWCDLGGIYVVAHVRGGAELGEAWHRAGMREHKHRSFEDLLDATDWLVDAGFTSREKLALRGGSNGGLVVGAAFTHRPDACRAVHCAVPLLDMVRYHRFLIARLWIPEYGDPDVAEEFAWLHSYSPYHRVVDGTCYPAVLLTTADGDSRVDPLHARKMAARLQAATTCETDRPVLLRVESDAGHGQGKPMSAQADELADVLTFLTWQLGVTVPD